MEDFHQFDIEGLQISQSEDQVAVLRSLARTAEACERYEDMCAIMKNLVLYCTSQNPPVQLGDEERNLLSVAYKNVIGARRASWRTVVAELESVGEEDTYYNAKREYKKWVENELKTTCNEVLSLLEANLLKSCDDEGEAKVFYLKMIGDYFRYLAESEPANTPDGDSPSGKDAAKYYAEAFEIASAKLPPTHPIRLGLALNYSVCYYEILKEREKACELAKSAFDEAISKLDQLEEVDYKDSTLIMQLLRDNLTLWTNDENEDEQ